MRDALYRVFRPVLLVGCVLLTGGCATQIPPVAMPEYDPLLLSGQALFGETVQTAEVTTFDVLGTDEAMRSFVTGHISDHRLRVARLKRLLRELNRNGYFDGTYQVDATRTASDTFRTRSGNCLSYTNMFVALAREAGLEAAYQMVDVPPTWDAQSGFLIRHNHINVVVRDIRWERFNQSDFTVDFNSLEPSADYDRHVVTDAFAESLFYANLFVDESVAGNPRAAFAYLKQAIDIQPNNPDLWINLGAFYNTHDLPALAVQAFEVVLVVAPRSKSAWSGMQRSYSLLGEHQIAAGYGHKVRSYRMKNPYYHYAMAQAAYKTADYDLALVSIDKAIALNKKDGRFHYLKALSHGQLGDVPNYEKSLKKARVRLARERNRRRDLNIAGLSSG